MITPNSQLTPAELLMHRFHEQTQGGMIISAVARFEGCLDANALHEALRTLQQRHSALRVIIRDSGHSSHFLELSEAPPIPLIWSEVDSLDGWPQAVLDLARASFDARHAPLARMRVLYNPGSNITDVILACHHAVSDGRSIMALYHELARLCAGETLPPPPYPGLRPVPLVPRRQGLVKPILGEIRQRIGLRPQLRRYPLTYLQQSPQPVEALRRRVWTCIGTEKIRARASLEQTTLYGALVAAVVLTLFDWHGLTKRSVEIRSPLDIRKLCDPPITGDPIGCYAALLGFVIPGADQQSFWQLARTAREGVQRYLDTGLWASGWRLLGRLLGYGIMPSAHPVFCNINNLGQIDELRTRSSRLIECSVTVNQQRMVINLMLFAATIEGALNLTLRSPWHTTEEVDLLLQNIIQRLEDACTTTPLR